MNDVIQTLDSSLTNTLATVDELLQKYQLNISIINELREEYRTKLVDARLKLQGSNPDLAQKLDNRMKAVQEFSNRAMKLATVFEESYEPMQQFIKQLRLQVAMLRSQLKFQIDALVEQEVMDKFGDNVKTLSQLINKVLQQVSMLQNNLIIVNELTAKVREIDREINKFLAGNSSKAEYE